MSCFIVLGLECFCNVCDEFSKNDTCVAKPKAGCFTAKELRKDDTDEVKEFWAYGCLAPEEKGLMTVSLCFEFYNIKYNVDVLNLLFLACMQYAVYVK